MMVFWNARLVFLAVPKTGSSAYEAALGPVADMVIRHPPGLKHAPLYRYNRFFRPMFARMGAPQMDLLAVVREPVSWLGSWWRYRQRPGMEGHPNATFGIDFDAFVRAYLQPEPPPCADVGSQARFLAPRPNGTRVTHLFRYEDQDALKRFLESRLGRRIQVPKMNVSPDLPLELSAETAERLRAARAEDFALWESAGA